LAFLVFFEPFLVFLRLPPGCNAASHIASSSSLLTLRPSRCCDGLAAPGSLGEGEGEGEFEDGREGVSGTARLASFSILSLSRDWTFLAISASRALKRPNLGGSGILYSLTTDFLVA